jgi:hypothetical protein
VHFLHHLRIFKLEDVQQQQQQQQQQNVVYNDIDSNNIQ